MVQSLELAAQNKCGLMGFALWVVYALLEYWLGKTEKIRPASVIELLIAIFVMTLMFFLTKGKKPNVDPKDGN